ncbi:GntR family transcriptional regulator [Isoptericola hypogeus]|uniref:GntR family transcriptional regulator n=1 Tax=Isoptericola hypogeus TaxID=300179 RepID=A0ABN2JKS1_9MICO
MSLSAPGPISRSVLSDEIHLVVRDMILEHVIAPGARINIDALSAQLGVSPTPLREALVRLESDGLVVKTPMRGYSTTPLLSVGEFVDLSQLRTVLESWTAGTAARRADDAARAALAAELDAARASFADPGDEVSAYRALMEHDSRFHTLVATLAGNALIVQTFERTHFHLHFLRLYLASRTVHVASVDAELVDGQFGLYLDEGGARGSRVLDEHAAIAAAVAAGDVDRASTLMREHIESSEARFEPVVAALAQLG